ncbi:L,D-transpeptidase [Fulvimarina sp. MAC3]|uniref:L,D-transpeptidase n=1 Tax=Fulvimarina sp. MAC3 TaxID=3148887 RepID=UPI0031FC4165
MDHHLPKFAIALSAFLAIGSLSAAVSKAEAGQRYYQQQPAVAPQEAREAWLQQLKRSQRVNAAGVVFGGAQPRQRVSSGRSIFSPDPFGARQVITRQPAAPRYAPQTRATRQSVQPRYPRTAATWQNPVREVAPRRVTSPEFLPQRVPYQTSQAAGTIVIDTNARFLYLVEANGMAMRYGVGVGKPGFSWRGTHNITAKKEWPSWTPPKEMIAREKKKGRDLPAFMPGGVANPLGARALYLGSTLYRIHGTNQPWTIGQAVSSGCIRMRNQDVEELYERARVGTKVVVL